jgi:hypothetical protein
VQRELVDPAAYVELWLKDSGHHPATGGDPAEYHRRYDTWLAWLEEQRVEAVGFGWVNLRAGGSGRHDLWDWAYDVEQPIAAAIAGWADGAVTDAGAGARLVLRDDVVQETVGPAGAEDPATIVLRQQRGFRRARQADTVVAALAGACDGELAVGPLLDAIAQLRARDPPETRATYLPGLRELVDEGFLVSERA